MKKSPLKKPTVGLVLASAPQYSETFFISKINGLLQEGFGVIVFADKKDKANLKIKCSIKYAPKIYSNNILMLFSALSVFLRLWWKGQKRVKSFLTIEKHSGKSFLQAFKKLYLNSHIINANVDFLHFGFATMALGRENLSEIIGAKMSVSIRGFDIGIYPLKHPGCYDLLWDKLDKLHYISDDLLKEAQKNRLPAGISTCKITPALDSSRIPQRNAPFFQKEQIRIATIGRLTWKKGYNYALDALKILKGKGYNFIYDIYGEGPDYEELLFAVNKLDLVNQINFKGKQDHELIIKNLIEYDLYLQPSLQEGFCNSVLEAQAAGLLCIVSDAEGLPENVINNITGWVVPSRDSQKLFEKICEIINLPQERLQSVSTAASLRVRKEFTLEKQRKLFSDFFKSMIK